MRSPVLIPSKPPPDIIPTTVCEHAYVKAPKLVLQDVKDSHLELVKDILSTMDTELVQFIMQHADEATLAELAVLREDNAFDNMVTDGALTIFPTEGALELRDKTNKVLCRGTTADLFFFAARFCRPALAQLVQMTNAGYIVWPEIKGLDLMSVLSRYRNDRTYSRGLDRISKSMILSQIDQGHTFYKFYDVVPPVDKIVHLGSGRNYSGSAYACRLKANTCLFIDPIATPAFDTYRKTWQHLREKILAWVDNGALIVSDIAYGEDTGTGHGLVDTGMQELLDFLPAGSIVKVPISLNIHYRGIPLLKPRPHNAELIVKLAPDGYTSTQIHDFFFPRVLGVNQKRNAAIYRLDFSANLKPPRATNHDLTRLAKTRLHPPEKLKRQIKDYHISRAYALCQAGDVYNISIRMRDMQTKTLDPDLPNKLDRTRYFDIREYLVSGPIADIDVPFIHDTNVLLSSIFITAERQGRTIYMDPGAGWCIKGL